MMDKTEPKRACNNCDLSPEALVDYGKLNDRMLLNITLLATGGRCPACKPTSHSSIILV